MWVVVFVGVARWVGCRCMLTGGARTETDVTGDRFNRGVGCPCAATVTRRVHRGQGYLMAAGRDRDEMRAIERRSLHVHEEVALQDEFAFFVLLRRFVGAVLVHMNMKEATA